MLRLLYQLIHLSYSSQLCILPLAGCNLGRDRRLSFISLSDSLRVLHSIFVQICVKFRRTLLIIVFHLNQIFKIVYYN